MTTAEAWQQIDVLLVQEGADEAYPPLQALRRWQGWLRAEGTIHPTREERNAASQALRDVAAKRPATPVDQLIVAGAVAMSDPDEAMLRLAGEPGAAGRWLLKTAAYIRARGEHPDDPAYWGEDQ